MKTFQIYNRPIPPCDPYLGFMERIRDMSEAYTLIAPENFMGADFVPFEAVWYSLPEYLRKNTNGPRMEFDAMRAWFLGHHFDHAYFDIDVELFEPIEIVDKPQQAGSGLLVGNGNPELGLACWCNYLRGCPSFCSPASIMFSGGMSLYEIPENKFKHHYAQGKY